MKHKSAFRTAGFTRIMHLLIHTLHSTFSRKKEITRFLWNDAAVSQFLPVTSPLRRGSGPRAVTPLLPPAAAGTPLRRTRRSTSARPRRTCIHCRIVYRRFVASNSDDDVTQPPSSSSLLRRPGIDDFVQVAPPFARLSTLPGRSRYWRPAFRRWSRW